jgi:trehalose synthase-fused probable maltokinase
MAPMAPNDRSSSAPTLSPDATPFDAAWLAAQRWFRHKHRGVHEVAVADATRVGEAGWLLVLDVRFADGGSARYLVPAVDGAGRSREPADGDPLWRALVAPLFDAPMTIVGSSGRFRWERSQALDRLLPSGPSQLEGLDGERLGVEQSNTSVRLGERLMLKLYRLLEPGINPEVELLAFLTDAGFRHAPTVAGWATYEGPGDEASAILVQSLVPASDDAWAWLLGRLSSPGGRAEAVAAAAEIGAITAALHAALRSRPDLPDFPARLARDDELTQWRAAAQAQLQAAIDAAGAEERARLERVAPAVAERFNALGDPAAALTSQRIHGDYHLGQLLTTTGGFVVTDFEGEPSRLLDERRRPASPLRDLAGMLRSLDYAARTAERRDIDVEAGPWLADARSALLTAYGEFGESPALTAFELEKACYEVRYEASFRPDWIWLPLEAIERMVA